MPVRNFQDPAGREWSVWDVVPSRRADRFLPSTMADGWLCFEAADEKRRLHPYGAEWVEMDDTALWELCRRADPVKPRSAPGPRPEPRPEPDSP